MIQMEQRPRLPVEKNGQHDFTRIQLRQCVQSEAATCSFGHAAHRQQRACRCICAVFDDKDDALHMSHSSHMTLAPITCWFQSQMSSRKLISFYFSEQSAEIILYL